MCACIWATAAAYDSGYDKLNHAYMYGGPEQAIRTINQNFGLDIQDYVTVNFCLHGEDCGCVRRCEY